MLTGPAARAVAGRCRISQAGAWAICSLERRFWQRYIREAPIVQGEDHRRIEPPHLMDPAHEIGILDHADAFGLDARLAFGLAFRGPTGARRVLDVEHTNGLTQDNFTAAGMVGRVTEQRVEVHGPDRKLRIRTQSMPI